MSNPDVIFVRRGLNPDTQMDDDKCLYSDISYDDPEHEKGFTEVWINFFKKLYLTDPDRIKFMRSFNHRGIDTTLIVVVTDDIYPNEHLARRVSASKETVTFQHGAIMYVVDKSYVDRNPNAFNFTDKQLPEPEHRDAEPVNNHFLTEAELKKAREAYNSENPDVQYQHAFVVDSEVKDGCADGQTYTVPKSVKPVTSEDNGVVDLRFNKAAWLHIVRGYNYKGELVSSGVFTEDGVKLGYIVEERETNGQLLLDVMNGDRVFMTIHA